MDSWLEFALERYNYWIVIVLMMTGLYIVFARGNLVKKVVGLNLFQTSVFIFYITIGKIAGGTAPIYIGGELDHGGGHGEGEEGAHEGEAHGGAAQSSENADLHAATESVDADAHSKIENAFGEAGANDLKAGLDASDAEEGTSDAASLHQTPEAFAGDKISNDALMSAEKPDPAGFDVAHGAANGHADSISSVADSAHGVGEVIYSNPLPHVLILTAIVVGVATTAVGLALAVRIREAYGTIEEDELESIDNVAEFGEVAGENA